jgi:hypothetical protein
LTVIFAALTAVLAVIVILGGIGMAMNHQLTGAGVIMLLVLALISIGPISYLRVLWRRRPHPLDLTRDPV